MLSISETLSFLRDQSAQSKKIILAGGCFDILHEGHIQFLSCAKTTDDLLIVLLESDKSIKQNKGDNRPYNTQQQRAEQLLTKTDADIVILLPYPFKDKDYDSLVSRLKPAIIATTLADPNKYHKDRQASLIGAEVLEVIARLPEHSSTELLNKYE